MIKIKKSLIKRAENGENTAQYELGNIYIKNRHFDKAVYWYRMCCAYNKNTAMGLLSSIFMKFNINNIKELIKLAKKGNIEAQIELGSLYVIGEGVNHSDKKAFYWWSKASNSGSNEADHRLKQL